MKVLQDFFLYFYFMLKKETTKRKNKRFANKRLKRAAKVLMNDYKKDKNLTDFTVLDFEKLYFVTK